MRSNKEFDYSYLLLVPFLAGCFIPLLGYYFRVRYVAPGIVMWLFIALYKKRNVLLPRGGNRSLFGTLIFLVLYSVLPLIYNPSTYDYQRIYELFSNLALLLFPLVIFHLSICNDRLRELRFIILIIIICLVIASIMTITGENVLEGASRSLTGSTAENANWSDVHTAAELGVGGYFYIYGIGLLIMPLLYGMSFMSVGRKIFFSLFIALGCLAVYQAMYSILWIALALAGALTALTKMGLKQRVINQFGVVCLVTLIIVSASPQVLGFIAKPLQRIGDISKKQTYQSRINSIADALSGDGETYVDTRTSLYWESLNVFLEYPIFGCGDKAYVSKSGKRIGGHSTIFDTLGTYGLFGLTIYLLIFICHYRYMRRIVSIAIGYKWWPLYYIFIIPSCAIMFINPLTGYIFVSNLMLTIPSTLLFFKKNGSGAREFHLIARNLQ
jgi:hypothetical protein